MLRTETEKPENQVGSAAMSFREPQEEFLIHCRSTADSRVFDEE
jgi:hypothetical protein